MGLFGSNGKARRVDVASMLTATCIDHLVTVVEGGALVALCRTSDGGAFSVTVTVDGEWEREYFRLPEELEDWLREAADYVEKHPPVPPSAPKRRRAA